MDVNIKNILSDLFDKYNAKDYFGFKEFDKERFDNGSLSHVASTWDEYIELHKKKFIASISDGLIKDIKNKNLDNLIKKIRPDQLIGKEIFKIITGIDLKGMNSTKMKEEFEKFCE